MYEIAFSKVQYFKLCFECPHISQQKETKNSICILLRHILGHEFLRACMLKMVRMITVMHVQNIIFTGSVFQIEVSDTSILLHLPYSKERTCIYIYWRYVQIEAQIFGILCVWGQHDHKI